MPQAKIVIFCLQKKNHATWRSRLLSWHGDKDSDIDIQLSFLPLDVAFRSNKGDSSRLGKQVG